MELFGISFSLFAIVYVVAVMVALAFMYVLENVHEVMLPLWMHHRSPWRRVLFSTMIFVLWFGIVGLVLTVMLPQDIAFTFALCAAFASFIFGKEKTHAWA